MCSEISLVRRVYKVIRPIANVSVHNAGVAIACCCSKLPRVKENYIMVAFYWDGQIKADHNPGEKRAGL